MGIDTSISIILLAVGLSLLGLLCLLIQSRQFRCERSAKDIAELIAAIERENAALRERVEILVEINERNEQAKEIISNWRANYGDPK